MKHWHQGKQEIFWHYNCCTNSKIRDIVRITEFFIIGWCPIIKILYSGHNLLYNLTWVWRSSTILTLWYNITEKPQRGQLRYFWCNLFATHDQHHISTAHLLRSTLRKKVVAGIILNRTACRCKFCLAHNDDDHGFMINSSTKPGSYTCSNGFAKLCGKPKAV